MNYEVQDPRESTEESMTPVGPLNPTLRMGGVGVPLFKARPLVEEVGA